MYRLHTMPICGYSNLRIWQLHSSSSNSQRKCFDSKSTWFSLHKKKKKYNCTGQSFTKFLCLNKCLALSLSRSGIFKINKFVLQPSVILVSNVFSFKGMSRLILLSLQQIKTIYLDQARKNMMEETHICNHGFLSILQFGRVMDSAFIHFHGILVYLKYLQLN